MPDPKDLRDVVRGLFAAQRLAVLSTHASGQPYGNLVAFVSTVDLSRLLFATRKETSKFQRLLVEPRVALLVDNRSNREADFEEGIAVTALGEARLAEGRERAGWAELYLSRHPNLLSFLEEADCALVCVDVERFLVSGFREVAELRLR